MAPNKQNSPLLLPKSNIDSNKKKKGALCNEATKPAVHKLYVNEHYFDSPYPHVPGLPDAYNIFHLHEGGLPAWSRERAIAAAKGYHALQKSSFIGYQINQALDYQHHFASYMDIHVNNVGDAFKEGNYTIHSKFMERAVLDYYAALWHAQLPHDDNAPESYWGFCLTMGSTEGNVYAMWNAREYLRGKKILCNTKVTNIVQEICIESKNNPHAYTPIAFYSNDSHYSIAKAMAMLDIRTFCDEGMLNYPGCCPLGNNGEWPAHVPSCDSGALDSNALTALVEFFASQGYPIIICFSYGTTFKGAYDDVALACKKLYPILKKYNLLEREVNYDKNDPNQMDVRTGYWFHVDGALGAAYMPYVEMAFHGGLMEKRGPDFDFRLPMVHSIAMSGHKWIGVPVPCGIYMTKTKYQMLPLEIPEYIGIPDTTFAGSRNGLSPMLLWDNIARNSFDDHIARVLHLEKLAVYVEKSLKHLQVEVVKQNLYVKRTPLALTVRFKRANDVLCRKYSLSNQDDSKGRWYSHVFIMDHVTHELVDALIQDLSKDGAFVSDIAAKVMSYGCLQSA